MDVRDDLIGQAFALSRARGPALLAFLGDFNVWHGDLAAMRGDAPRVPEPAEKKPTETAYLAEVLLMARAIELLEADCKTALSEAYASRKITGAGHGHDAATCRHRLLDIYEQLRNRSHDRATPEWVEQRAHAGSPPPRRRSR